MRIKSHDDRRPARLSRIRKRSLNDGAVPEMHAVEDADGEEKRAGKGGEFGNRSQDRKHGE